MRLHVGMKCQFVEEAARGWKRLEVVRHRVEGDADLNHAISNVHDEALKRLHSQLVNRRTKVSLHIKLSQGDGIDDISRLLSGNCL